MSFVVVLSLFMLFSNLSQANFQAELDLLKPNFSCVVKGEKDSWFRSFNISADELNKKWQLALRVKDNEKGVNDVVDFNVALWQKGEKQGSDLSFIWESGHATLQGKYTLSEGKSSWSPKIKADFNPYFDASLQYEYLTNGGKWQFSWKKNIRDLVLSTTLSYYNSFSALCGIGYKQEGADIDLSLQFAKEGISKGALKLGFKQDIYQGYLRVDIDRDLSSTVTMQFHLDGLKLSGKVKENDNQISIGTNLFINEFTFIPAVSLSKKGLVFGLKMKIA